VRSAINDQFLVLLEQVSSQLTRLPTSVPSNESVPSTTLDAQVCSAQDLKAGGTSLDTFTFHSIRILDFRALSAHQSYTQVVDIDLGFLSAMLEFRP
jgi:hypothetical protein